jgi:hypothetical protein
MGYNPSLLLKEILATPIIPLYKTSYVFLYGVLYYSGLAVIALVMDLISLLVKRPKRVSIVEECMSEFPFRYVLSGLLSRVNVIIEGFYDCVFVGSTLLYGDNAKKYAGDLIDAYNQKVNGRTFAELLHDLSSTYIIPIEGEPRVGPLVLFLPGLIRQHVDFRTVGDLLAQSCCIPNQLDSYDFYQKLDNIDDLTRDVAYAVDFFLRSPYNNSLLNQPPFIFKIRSTLRKLTVPYIDSLISRIKIATADEMVELAVYGFEIRMEHDKLSYARFSKNQGIAALSQTLSDLRQVDPEQKRTRFKYFFGNMDIVNVVREKLVKELEDIKAKLDADEIEYKQVTSAVLPNIPWYGGGLYAFLPLDYDKRPPVVLGKEE